MKKNLLIQVLALGAFVCGCENFDLKTRDELKAAEAPKTGAKQVEGPAASANRSAAKTAPAAAATEDSDSQMRQLNGRVDEVENETKQTNLSIQGLRDDRAKEKQETDQKNAALEEEIKKLTEQVAALSEQISKAKPAALDPQAIVGDGDALRDAKKYKEAIVSYQKYRDTFPKGNKYAEVTYKIGLCFDDLKMPEDARVFYKEVVSNHSKSPEAKKAAKRLKALK